MGFFSRKRSNKKQPPKLICKPNDINSFKCILLAAHRNLDLDISWSEASALDSNLSNSLDLEETDSLPIIEDRNITMSRAEALLGYLNIKGGAPAVHPRKARILAQQNYWIELLDDKLEPLLLDIEGNKDAISTILAAVDKQLSIGPFIVSEFTLADIHWLAAYLVIEEKINDCLTPLIHFSAWLKHMQDKIPNYAEKLQPHTA
jgi:glutathione S-transferase